MTGGSSRTQNSETGVIYHTANFEFMDLLHESEKLRLRPFLSRGARGRGGRPRNRGQGTRAGVGGNVHDRLRLPVRSVSCVLVCEPFAGAEA